MPYQKQHHNPNQEAGEITDVIEPLLSEHFDRYVIFGISCNGPHPLVLSCNPSTDTEDLILMQAMEILRKRRCPPNSMNS